MKKTRYSDEQIVRILREADQGTTSEVAKRHRVFVASIYVWRLFSDCEVWYWILW